MRTVRSALQLTSEVPVSEGVGLASAGGQARSRLPLSASTACNAPPPPPQRSTSGGGVCAAEREALGGGAARRRAWRGEALGASKTIVQRR